MRTMKKLLCIILSVMMLASCLVPSVFGAEQASNFSDVSSDKLYSDAVSTLNLMGIINGYEENGSFSFKPEQNVTRAEFTAMLMRTLNYGSTGSKSAAGLPFTDIDDNDTSINWAIPNINTAYGLGIINGYEDSTFRPNANVAYEEAVKMIVCTLGYGNNVSVDVEPWYANFITIANQIGITKNATQIGAAETPATRACIAQLLYDSLEIELVDGGVKTTKTILSDYLGYVKNTGVISSDGITSLSSQNINLRDNEIQITARDENSSVESAHTYSTTDDSLKNYLGYGVDFYYKDNGSGVRTLMFCVLNDAETLEINASNIDASESSDSEIVYENPDTGINKSAKLESDNVVIFNRKLYGSNSSSSSFSYVKGYGDIPNVGSLKLIDSDGNGKYDVIIIDSYEVYYVSAKSTTDYTITDKLLHNDAKLQLNTDSDKNLSIVNKSGSTVNFSSIKTGDIICYAESTAGLRKAVVVTDKITGSVSASKGNKITISNKEYSYSLAAPWMNTDGDLDMPSAGDSGTYYLDINGDVVAYNKNETTKKVYYGYILNYGQDPSSSSFDDVVVFTVLNDSNVTSYIRTYKNTTVDDTKCSTGSAVVSALTGSSYPQYKGDFTGDKAAMQQLIKYTTTTYNGNTVFDRIITADYSSGTEDTTNDTLWYLDGEEMTLTYNSSSKTLSGGGLNLKVSSTAVFVVPADRNVNDFKKTTASSGLKNGTEYTAVDVFDAKNNIPKAIVVYLSDDAPISSVDSSSPVYIVTSDSSEALNGSDRMLHLESPFKVEDGRVSQQREIWLSEESDSIASNLKTGDVFRATTDNDGYVKVASEYMIYDVDGSNSFGITDAEGNSVSVNDVFDEDWVQILGTVDFVQGDDISVQDVFLSVSDVSSATILVYTEDGQETSVIESSDSPEDIIESLSTSQTSDTPNKVLIFMEDGRISLVYILPV